MSAPSTPASFPSLDVLLKSMNTLEQSSKAQPKLWSPQLQTEFIGPSATLGSPNTGKAVMAVPPLQQQDLFMKNYINKQDGVKDLKVSMANAADIHKKATLAVGNPPSEHVCKVFPPLLVRYQDPQAKDAYIPVELSAGAEMHYARSFPDLVLNFHADTHAVTVTVCRIEPFKMKVYELAMQVLYSMTTTQPDKMLTVTEFTALYDNVRYNLLRQYALPH